MSIINHIIFNFKLFKIYKRQKKASFNLFNEETTVMSQLMKSTTNNSTEYTVFQKSDAKIKITITTTNLIRIKYPLSSFNYHLSGANVANYNKIHRTVFEQQLFKKWNSKTEVSNMENSPYQFVRNTTSYSLCSKWSPLFCTDTCMSLVQTVHSLLLPDFLSADPVASICRRSQSSAEQDQSLLGNSSNNFLAR